MGSSQSNEHVNHEMNAGSGHGNEGHAFLQSVIDSSLDIIQLFTAIRDDDGKIIDFVWRIQNLKGLSQNGEVIGASLLEKNVGVKSSGIFDRMVNVTETGIPSEQEQYYSHEQFADQWFYQVLVKQDDGVMMTTRDITAQKEATIEISQHAHFLTSVTSTVPGAILITSYPGGEIVYNSRNSLQFAGVTLSSLVKPGGFPDLLPDDAAILSKYHDRFMRMYDSLENIADLRVKNEDGKMIWLQLRGSIYSRDENGDVTSTLHIIQDITKAKESEIKTLEIKEHLVQRSLSRYLTLFNAIEEGYCIIQMIFDEKGEPYNWRFLEVNPAFERHNSISNTTGKTVLESLPEVAARSLQIFGKVSVTGESVKFRESGADGSVVEVSAYQIGNPNDRTIAVIYSYLERFQA